MIHASSPLFQGDLMNRSLRHLAFGSVAILSLASAASAESISGSANGLNWTATSYIVGQTSTATAAAGGDPRYVAPMPQYSGVASLIMNYTGGSFICTGSLLPDRRTIVTAAHCVNNTVAKGTLLSTTAYFYGGSDSDTAPSSSPLATAVAVSNVFINSGYTGQVIDQNDIAVLRLDALAPAFAASYALSNETDLSGDGLNVAGYGQRSTIGGAFGANAGTGRLRQGDNRYDFRFGDSDFGGFWNGFFGSADNTHTWLSDFDNGAAANDTTCRVAGAFALGGAKYCNTGVGADEVGTAGGDSGGPQFDSFGRISSVTSFGLTFGTGFGDFRAGLNSSWGEFSGYVPIYLHKAFIEGLLVPEPGTLSLALLAGLGLMASRRRRQAAV
jgi:Trypsin